MIWRHVASKLLSVSVSISNDMIEPIPLRYFVYNLLISNLQAQLNHGLLFVCHFRRILCCIFLASQGSCIEYSMNSVPTHQSCVCMLLVYNPQDISAMNWGTYDLPVVEKRTLCNSRNIKYTQKGNILLSKNQRHPTLSKCYAFLLHFV